LTLTTYTRKYTRCAQLMITGVPYRILGMPCNGKRKQSSLRS